MAGNKQNFGSHVEEIDENVDIEKPTSFLDHFLDHVHIGCTRRECKPNDAIVEQYKKQQKNMFESRISAGATEKLPEWEKPLAKTSAYIWDALRRECKPNEIVTEQYQEMLESRISAGN